MEFLNTGSPPELPSPEFDYNSVYASVAEAPFHHIARERIQPLKNPETEFWISR